MATYYHNPKCSKSRQGLELLQNSSLEFEIKEYLKEGFEHNELKELFSKLGKTPAQVVRNRETIYKELDLDASKLEIDDWIEVIIENPILMERPILVNGDKAAIGRPLEEIEKIL